MGVMGRVFTGIRAPSTLGTFLRTFTFGHVRVLDAVAADFLVNLIGAAPALRDAAVVTYLDIDDTVKATHGYTKQGPAGRRDAHRPEEQVRDQARGAHHRPEREEQPQREASPVELAVDHHPRHGDQVREGEGDGATETEPALEQRRSQRHVADRADEADERDQRPDDHVLQLGEGAVPGDEDNVVYRGRHRYGEDTGDEVADQQLPAQHGDV